MAHTLIEEIKTAPEPLQRELFDFLTFLKSRDKPTPEDDLTPLATSAWNADWASQVEDDAWRNL